MERWFYSNDPEHDDRMVETVVKDKGDGTFDVTVNRYDGPTTKDDKVETVSYTATWVELVAIAEIVDSQDDYEYCN